jgi:hypothetical protein
MKKIALAVLLAIGSASAMAGEVYGQIGTEGIGMGYSHAINDQFNIRGEVNGFSKGYTQHSNDLTYNGDLKLGGASVLADYFPFSGRFRMTGGAIINKNKLTGTATGNGRTYIINGTPYAYSAGDQVSADVKFGKVSPYLGIGFGHTPKAKGFGFFTDIGVIFQRPESTIIVSRNLFTQVAQADIDAERRSLQNSVDKFKYYPVLKAGVSYAF